MTEGEERVLKQWVERFSALADEARADGIESCVLLQEHWVSGGTQFAFIPKCSNNNATGMLMMALTRFDPEGRSLKKQMDLLKPSE